MSKHIAPDLLQYNHMLKKIRVPQISDKALIWLVVVSVVALGVSSFLYYQAVYKNPERVFYGMLDKNFSTGGFTRLVDSEGNGSRMSERSQAQFVGTNIVENKTELQQNNDTIRTHVIATPEKEFVRYTAIEAGTVDEQNRKVDFSSLVNQWADYGNQPISQVFAQSQLGIFPVGSVSVAKKRELIDFIKKNNVFSVNYQTVETEKIEGRLTYMYDVSVQPQSYIHMLKTFGEAAGLADQVEQFDPAQYEGAEPISFRIGVDVLNRRLVSLASPGDTSRKETYAGYGIQKPVAVPQAKITVQELQQKLAELQ